MFKIAETEEELEGAFRLLHDTYVDMGFMQPDKSQMRVTFYHMLPNTTTLVGLYRGEVVATVSIIRDNPDGLPLETDFDIRPLRETGSVVAEISSLAVRKDFQMSKGLVLFPLLKFLWIYCRHYFAIDQIVMATNPFHSDLFEALILFTPLSDKVVENYGFANGAKAVAKVLDLRLAPMRYAAKYADEEASKNLYKFMVTPEMGGVSFDNIRLPRRWDSRIFDSVITPEILKNLFVKKTKLFQNLSWIQKRLLLSHYGHPSFIDAVPELRQIAEEFNVLETQIYRRRFAVRCIAQANLPFADEALRMDVFDVSSGGLLVKSSGALEEGRVYQLKVVVSEFSISTMTAKVVWQDRSGSYGLQVIRASKEWDQFIQHLDINGAQIPAPPNHLKLIA